MSAIQAQKVVAFGPLCSVLPSSDVLFGQNHGGWEYSARMDCGLGGSWREIMDNVDELQSQQVLMRSLVLRPPQELIAQLEEVDPELWARRREVSRGRRVSDPRPLGAPMDY